MSGMTQKELLCLVDEKVNEIFLAYQNANGIESGDISPEDALCLDKLQEKLADLIVNVCEKNRASGKETGICTNAGNITAEEKIETISKAAEYAKRTISNSRIVKITAGMGPDYEIIVTNAPDHVIEKQLAIINTMEEEGIMFDDAYEYLMKIGYYVEVVGSDNDSIDWDYDATFDLYDYEPDISLLER